VIFRLFTDVGFPTWSAVAACHGVARSAKTEGEARAGDTAFPQRAEFPLARCKSGVDVLHSQARFGLCHRTPSQQPLFLRPTRAAIS